MFSFLCSLLLSFCLTSLFVPHPGLPPHPPTPPPSSSLSSLSSSSPSCETLSLLLVCFLLLDIILLPRLMLPCSSSYFACASGDSPPTMDPNWLMVSPVSTACWTSLLVVHSSRCRISAQSPPPPCSVPLSVSAATK